MRSQRELGTLALAAAQAAGDVIRSSRRDAAPLEAQLKGAGDYVTVVDRAAEAAAIAVLHDAEPSIDVLAEERGGEVTERMWVIDPLDGTTNFLHGVPQYCVSIGMLHKGVPTQAVVFDPNRNELFTATRGVGAYLNDRRIRVSRTDKMEDALLGTGFPFKEVAHLDEYVRMLKNAMRTCSGVRRPGAAALDLAWVACGRYDGFWEMGLSPWDMAAGALLVREAGGLVGDFEGNEGFLDKGRIVAANSKLFASLLKLLHEK